MKQKGTTLVQGLLLLGGVLSAGCADSPRSHPGREYPGPVAPSTKEIKPLGTPWEQEFGLVQGVKSGGLVFVAGQVSLDDKGGLAGKGNMEAQLRQAYANVAKVLQQFSLTMADVLEETLYVTDMPVLLTVGPKVRRDIYSDHPEVASTVLQVQRLAFSEALVEIRVVAKAPVVVLSRPSDGPSEGAPRRRGGRGRGGYGGPSPY
ncbi:MAG: RidA family protein [Nitrospiraceae bacterium]|nr:RidA family protein [Nitrospiraceae bacterium]